MIALLAPWWQARSRREQWLLAVMLALLAGLLLWLGLFRPLALAQARAVDRLATASSGLAEVQALAPLLRGAGTPANRPAALARLEARLKASGVTSERLELAPDGQVSLSIAAIRGQPLLALVAALEGQDGLVVTRLTARRNDDGSVAATLLARDTG